MAFEKVIVKRRPKRVAKPKRTKKSRAKSVKRRRVKSKKGAQKWIRI